MSTSTLHFSISNPAISFLLHDCVKSPHNQIGFLFGEIHRKVSDVTSDSQSNNECVEITVSITASLPVEDLFFSKDGTLNKEILDTVLGEYKEDVVGWYSFTRNQDLSPSIYQLFLAHQLCDYFSHIPNHLFLYFRISTNVVLGQNFTYTNKFLCTTGPDTSTPVELHIRQLGESTHAYNAHKPVTSHSEIFESVLNTIEWKSEDMVTSFETLQDLLSTKLFEQIDQQYIEPNQLSQENHSMIETPLDSANHRGNSDDFLMQVSPGAPPDLPDSEPQAEEETMDQSTDLCPNSDPIHRTGNRSVPSISTNTTKLRGVPVRSPVKHDNSPSTLGKGRGILGATKQGKLSNRALSPAPVGLRNSPRTQSPMRTASPFRSNGNTANARQGTVRNNSTSARGGKNPAVGVHQTNHAGHQSNQSVSRGQRETQSNTGVSGGRKNSGSSTSPGQTAKPVRILSRNTPLDLNFNDTRASFGRMNNSQLSSDVQQALSDGDSSSNSPDLSRSQTPSSKKNFDKSASTYSSQEY